MGEKSRFQLSIEPQTLDHLVNVLGPVSEICTFRFKNPTRTILVTSKTDQCQCLASIYGEPTTKEEKKISFTININSLHLDISRHDYDICIERKKGDPTLWVSKAGCDGYYSQPKAIGSRPPPIYIDPFPKNHQYRINIPIVQLKKDIAFVEEFEPEKMQFTIVQLEGEKNVGCFFLKTSIASLRGKLCRFYYSLPDVEMEREEHPFKKICTERYSTRTVTDLIKNMYETVSDKHGIYTITRENRLRFGFSPELPMVIEYSWNSQSYIKIAFFYKDDS